MTLSDQFWLSQDAGFYQRVGQAMILAATQVQAEETLIPLVASSVANPTVLQTSTAHWFTSGDLVRVSWHAGSVPVIDGLYVATVIDTTHFSIPVNVTTAGAFGWVAKEVYNHAARSNFACDVLRNPERYQTQMARAVATNAAITSASLDGDIEFTVNSLWNAFTL